MFARAARGRCGGREVKAAAAMVEKEEGGPGGISEEEAAQYDRQIRLWGLEAQKRSVGLEAAGRVGRERGLRPGGDPAACASPWESLGRGS